jgi:aryl-phospho-beta-D-glucosidase BglC (GH1 family)
MRSNLLIALFLAAFASAQTSPLPATRAHHLQRGINLSEWFAQVWDAKGYTKEHFESHTSARDIALIRQLGFDHVRLSVNPQPMFHHGQADRIPPEYLGYLDNAVKMILEEGLAVIIDIHPDSDFKARLAQEDGFGEQFADFWRALAGHYSKLDPDLVFFEVLNEPEVHDRYRWSGMQEKLVAAIRSGAPQHTIIVAGANYSDNDDLLFLDQLRDPNLIYNFHFYDPHVFTHQGATWGVNFWHWEKNLAYPSDLAQAEEVAALIPDPMNRLQVMRYGLDHWDAHRVDAEISAVADWARQRGVTVTCNEFGVHRGDSNPADRARWLTDVRTSLEKHGIGWTMWDYSGSFALVTKKDGVPAADEGTVRALGLKMAEGK